MAVQKYITDGSIYAWSLLRLVLGYIFLWAFLDKTFGLGTATCHGKDIGCSAAWVHGGSPTTGFLSHATTGPLANFYQHLAGHMWVDWLFMLGLLVVGVGLLFGTWIRTASLIGVTMLLFMWSALLWPANTPAVDEHIVYAIVLFGVALTAEHQPWTMQKRWTKSALGKMLPFLK
jgi:thiosulfate dehydrogenase [quinone] large subunit